jgi:hypothetical protein
LPVDVVSPNPVPVDIVSPLPVPVDIVSPDPINVDIVSSVTIDVNVLSLPTPVDVNVIGTVTVTGSVTVSGTVAVGPTVTPGTGATNLGKAEDALHASGDVGVMSLAVRNDAGTALAGNGDYIAFTTDSSGKVYATAIVTSVIPGTAATNLGKAEDAVHASGDTGVMALAVRNDAATALAANGDYIPVTTDATGKVYATAIVTSVVPGTAATNLGKAEDAVHASGDTGVMALAVRQDTLAALAANGDYIPLTTDSLGRLNVNVAEIVFPLSSSTNGQPIVVDTVAFVTLHTVPANSRDVITIYVTNIGTTDRTFVLGFGGTATGQQMTAFIPARETVVVADAFPLNAAQVVSGGLNVAGTCRVVGHVSRRAV